MIRAVTAIPGHACFGVFMGAFYGAAKKYEGMCDLTTSKKYRRLALIVPALLHGLYDFTASMESRTGGWIFLMYLIALFLTAFLLVRKLSRNDEENLRKRLFQINAVMKNDAELWGQRRALIFAYSCRPAISRAT